MIQYPFDVGGTTTRVLEAGSGGTPMVLCHGLAARADRWKANIDVLADAGYHVFAYDHPGHGLADKSGFDDFSIEGFGRFLAGFLARAEDLGVDPAAPWVVVGTSFGGAAAAWYAAHYRDRVAALVLVGTMGIVPPAPGTTSGIRSRMGNVTMEGIERKLKVLFRDPDLATPELVREEFHINNSPGAKESFDLLGAYLEERVAGDMVTPALLGAAADLPCLVVWGSHDRSFPVEVGHEAARQLPGSELVIIDGTGHAPYLEAPKAFTRALLSFLDRAGVGGRTD